MRILSLALAATVTAFALPAQASNFDFLKYAPISRLSASELTEFSAAIGKSLDEASDGQALQWKAPKSEFNATVTPMKRYAEGKRECREARIESEARELKASGLLYVLQVGQGLGNQEPGSKTVEVAPPLHALSNTRAHVCGAHGSAGVWAASCAGCTRRASQPTLRHPSVGSGCNVTGPCAGRSCRTPVGSVQGPCCDRPSKQT